MNSTQHSAPCQVYLHPAACSSRAAVEAIQRRTGLLIITSPKGRAKAVKASNATGAPFGGDAA